MKGKLTQKRKAFADEYIKMAGMLLKLRYPPNILLRQHILRDSVC